MYVITAATGNTGKIIAQNLLKAGKSVKVISRKAEHLADLVAQGAVAAVGDLTDAAFLTQAFEGATAVYLLVPPKWDVTDWRAYQRTVSDAYVQALRATGVTKAVFLSSQGAHLLNGAGPVSGAAEVEVALREVDGLSVLSLRPGYFMQNFFGLIDLIKHAGIIGYSLRGDLKMPLVHTRDIAEVATKRLIDLGFSGHTHEFIGGAADLTMQEATAILGAAIGKPELPYVEFSQADAKAGMMQAGIPETIADGYNELFDALNKGTYQEGYVRTPEVTTPTTLEWFAENEFKHAFA
ncbi:MAG: NAD(P)H-binding protein [Bacteroidota bacterium]